MEPALKCGASEGSTTLAVTPIDAEFPPPASAAAELAFGFGDADGAADGLANAIDPPHPATVGNACVAGLAPTVATLEADDGVGVVATPVARP